MQKPPDFPFSNYSPDERRRFLLARVAKGPSKKNKKEGSKATCLDEGGKLEERMAPQGLDADGTKQEDGWVFISPNASSPTTHWRKEVKVVREAKNLCAEREQQEAREKQGYYKERANAVKSIIKEATNLLGEGMEQKSGRSINESVMCLLEKIPKEDWKALKRHEMNFDTPEVKIKETIDAIELQTIFQAIRANTITKLTLRKCGLQDPQFIELTTTLANNTSLLFLDLQGNRITDSGAKTLLCLLLSMSPYQTSLWHINFEGNLVSEDMIKYAACILKTYNNFRLLHPAPQPGQRAFDADVDQLNKLKLAIFQKIVP